LVEKIAAENIAKHLEQADISQSEAAHAATQRMM